VYIRIGKQIAIIYRFNKLVFDQGGNEFVNRRLITMDCGSRFLSVIYLLNVTSMFYLQIVGDGNDNCNKFEEFQFKAFSEQVHILIKGAGIGCHKLQLPHI
jgi:hypothetical protein